MLRKISSAIIVSFLLVHVAAAQDAENAAAEESTTEATSEGSTVSEAFESELSSLKEKEQELTVIQEEISAYNGKLGEIRNEINSLENRLEILDTSIEITNLNIRSVQIQIAKKEVDLRTSLLELDDLAATLTYQERQLRTYLNLLLKQEYLYFSKDRVLYSDPTLLFGGDLKTVLTRKRYLEQLHSIGTELIASLKDTIEVEKLKKDQLTVEQEELRRLSTRLEVERTVLEQQQQSRRELLALTQGQELTYQEILQEKRLEEQRVEAEVEDLYQNLDSITDALAIRDSIVNSGSLSAAEIEERLKLLQSLGVSGTGTLGMDWPVPPTRGLSAYFRDSGYRNFFGVAHNAIDIPSPQATPIRAPADGFVTKTADNGLGYSYIVVAHGNGIMSLYGHVYSIMVEPGEFVSRGSVIGLSGGQPGTRGAGWMTTGSHLHFEVFLNGKHTDPLQFLDRSVLP